MQGRFAARNLITVTTVSLAYLGLASWLIGFKADQVFLVCLFNLLFYLSETTKRFILGFAIFIVFWILFDSMKAFPNYRFNTVHIADINALERRLFGIPTPHRWLTPNEFWLRHTSPVLDILSGFFYLCWMPLPLAFAGYLFAKDKEAFLRFSLTFLLVNLLGFVLYYIFPAAPPWYVELYGYVFHPHTPGHTAGLARFDQWAHLRVFASLYEKSSNVFAAMPSLHAAYPMIVFYYGLKRRMGLVNILFGVIMCGIWFAAVYTGHHYVLDILAGIACGILGIVLFNEGYRRVGWFGKFMEHYKELISRSPRP